MYLEMIKSNSDAATAHVVRCVQALSTLQSGDEAATPVTFTLVGSDWIRNEKPASRRVSDSISLLLCPKPNHAFDGVWRRRRGSRPCIGEDDSIPLRQVSCRSQIHGPLKTGFLLGLETGTRVAAGFPEHYFQLRFRAAL
jgi:hypothetical protein